MFVAYARTIRGPHVLRFRFVGFSAQSRWDYETQKTYRARFACIFEVFDDFGAPEGNNLEPFSAPELLEELEGWTEVLKSEPEVIHRLKAFAEATENASVGAADDLEQASSFEEPSP